MTLPDPCKECKPFGGNYRLVVKAGLEATDRCICDRGRILRAMEEARHGRRIGEPGVESETLLSAVSQLAGGLRFMPGDASGRLAIAREIGEFAANAEELAWLVQHAPRVFSEWPGLRELRAFYCSAFGARDGINVDSVIFAETGIPAVEPRNLIEAPDYKRLVGPESNDTDLAGLVQSVANVRTMPASPRILTPPEYMNPEYMNER